MKSIRFLLIIITVLIILPVYSCAGSNDDKIGQSSAEQAETQEANILMNITVGDTVLTATLADNSTAVALKELLSEGPVTIDMRDYGSMEKVGAFPCSLPRNDEQIRTEAGDLILYQGSAFVIYYAPNSWNFTRIGKINNITGEELKRILGDGNVAVKLSIE